MNDTTPLRVAALVPLLLLAAPLTVGAQPPAPPPPAGAQPPAPPPPVGTEPAAPPPATETSDDGAEGIGLNLDLGLASSYVFRGWNVFQSTRQTDPHMLLAPGVTWAIADSGFSVGYWGAYQLTGPNIGENTDGALSAEQDLFVTYDLELPHDMALAFGLFAYFYPAAAPSVMGASVPLYLEPAIGFTYATAVDLGVDVVYFGGVQDEPDIRGISYLYVNPKVSKSLELTEALGLDLAFGYGFKLFQEGNEGRSNVHDLLLEAGLPIHPGGPSAYVTPGIGLAWTNVEDVTDEETGEVVEERGFSDGFVVWGKLNVGMDI